MECQASVECQASADSEDFQQLKLELEEAKANAETREEQLKSLRDQLKEANLKFEVSSQHLTYMCMRVLMT